jgi:hypothetical protein
MFVSERIDFGHSIMKDDHPIKIGSREIETSFAVGF